MKSISLEIKLPDGWMSPSELQWLYERSLEVESIIELGTYKGRSTYVLAFSNKPVITIDDFSMGTEEEARFNLLSFKNVEIVKAKSTEVDKSADMVFIDTSHTYEDTKKEIEYWLPRTKKLICGHDYDSGWPGVIKAVNETFGTPDGVVDSLWHKWLI